MQQPSESTVHLLPFMLPVGYDELRGLYQKIKNAMIDIHKMNRRNNVKELEKIAIEWLVQFGICALHIQYIFAYTFHILSLSANPSTSPSLPPSLFFLHTP